MRRFSLFVGLFLCLTVGFAATQEEDELAPFPSRFRVAVRDPEVRLTWRDASAAVAGYRVYRHTEEITEANLAEATLVETVEEGVESYLDAPQPGSYHYAVVAESTDGTPYKVFIPFRNKTTEPIRITKESGRADPAAELSGITARAEDERIMVSFEGSPEKEAFMLFRSTRPLDSTDALAEATRIGPVSPGDTPLGDYPVPGVPYYYGVFSQALLEEGTPFFEPGVTVTSEPVQIPLSATRVTLPPFDAAPRSRNPLPFLRLTRELEEGDGDLPRNPVSATAKLPISEETENAVRSITEELPREEPRTPDPQILPEDRSAGNKGPAYALSTIATGAFRAERWEEAETLLDNLLSTTLPAPVEARAHFYLAQTYYFTDRQRLAFLEFLMAQERYYTETRSWMDAILRELDES